MKKRLLSALLCLVMVLALLPVSAFAATISSLKDQAKTSGTIITHVGKTSKEAIVYLDASMKNKYSQSLAAGTDVYLTHYAPQITICAFTYNGRRAYIRTSSLTDVAAVTMPEQNERALVKQTATVNNATGTTTSFYVRKTAEAVNGTNCIGIYYEGATLNILDSDYSTDWMKIKYTDGYIGYFQKKFVDLSTLTDVTVDTTQPVGNYISTAQADAQSTVKGWTVTINSKEDWKQITSENESKLTRLIINYWDPSEGAFYFKNKAGDRGSYHLKELWIGQECDAEKILSVIEASNYYGMLDSGNLNTAGCFVLVSNQALPNGISLAPSFSLRLYSGDVVSAAAKGVSGTKEFCTKHVYNQQLETADRVMEYASCYHPTRFYYSCEKCGKCEYNKNHTFVGEGVMRRFPSHAMHKIGDQLMTNAAYIGVNTAGQRVYWQSCLVCGKSYRQVELEGAPGAYKTSGMSAEMTYAEYLDMIKKGLAARESKALTGSNTTDMFTVSGTAVSAKVSSWAQSGVNWAKQNGLVDEALLGSDYTKAMTRLQFCSVAVKLAESMSGTTITPAASSTFTDTDNAYALKAYAAGITGGTGDGTTFSPNANLNRQQMATFIYRALQYVKANSAVRYTAYTSKLGSYTDAGQLSSWAKEPMAFMNALGLVGGTSATALSPMGLCTIQQALIVANRSLDAGDIGWYQTRTDRGRLRDEAVGRYTVFGVVDIAFSSNKSYIPGEKYWATAIRRSDFDETSDMLYFTDAYTGATLVAYKENFVAIRDN